MRRECVLELKTIKERTCKGLGPPQTQKRLRRQGRKQLEFVPYRSRRPKYGCRPAHALSNLGLADPVGRPE